MKKIQTRYGHGREFIYICPRLNDNALRGRNAKDRTARDDSHTPGT